MTASRLPTPYRPENPVVADLLAFVADAVDWREVSRDAQPWVGAVRDHPAPFWAMESLLAEYPISSAEGLALMHLAEALLRIPDLETAIVLTADQLGRAEFDANSDSTLAHLSAAAIHLAKHFLPEATAAPDAPDLIARIGARSVVAATLRAVQLLGHQFVLGEDMAAATQAASKFRASHSDTRFSFDMLGEGARTAADAARYFEGYRKAIEHIARHAPAPGPPENNDGISIKLSALHPRYEATQRERVMRELVPRVWQLCELAARANINLTIDAEEAERLELSLDVLEALMARVARHYPQWQGLGLAVQAYQTRAHELVAHLIGLARRYQVRLMCRLVKGAYWDSEIKRAQELGLAHYPVFTHKGHTDVSYLACAQALLAAPDAVYSQFATHNAGTIAAIMQMADRAGAPYELQRLHGMGAGIYREVLRKPRAAGPVACRVYAPVGKHRDLLAYLVRRLLENGANSSFVHQLADESIRLDRLLRSPLALEQHATLPAPADLYGPNRKNSEGLDLTVPEMRAPLEAGLARLQATPRIPVAETDALAVDAQVELALQAFPQWNGMPVARRAEILRKAGDLLQADLPQFAALLVLDAYKTWGDAVAEVREAIDFLRYYAQEAERIMQPLDLPGPTGETNELRLTGRGAWVCISPWNFPLAIFIGQVAAALVTGNTVLAKPAEQTPMVAAAAIGLLKEAGVPSDALHLLHGPGETVGAALVAAPEIAGVVFTGSTEVAKSIQRALAGKVGPIVPLIAETGGINAMLVDSSALPEQVTDAVLQSAFRSAGQRCSALRLLCVHDAIADAVIEMIGGAARELSVGDPGLLSTDLGPLIDGEAHGRIRNYLVRVALSSAHILSAEVSGEHIGPHIEQQFPNLLAPQIIEVESIAAVQEEVFGPVLHVMRWRGDPAGVIDQINALGYGLTLGIQTRIDGRALDLAHQARVGNIYVNRNMIGAVVGVQPFGGEGLSGSGPKAGGPHYLYRFCNERTLTINTAATGGNVSLLARL